MNCLIEPSFALLFKSLLILITIWNYHDSFKLLEMTLLMEFLEIALFLLAMLLKSHCLTTKYH